MSYLLLLLLIGSLDEYDCARILAFFPAPSISHQVTFRPITQELARRGHQVTVITPDPAFPNGNTPENLTEIDVHDISYAFQKKIFSISSKKTETVAQNEVFYNLFLQITNTQFSDENVKRVIDPKSNSYDLLLLESILRPTLALSHVFKAPVIQISSFGAIPESLVLAGSAGHPILYPTSFYQRKVHKHGVWDKITALYNEYVSKSISNRYIDLDEQMMRSHFGDDLPSLKELSDKVDMVFLNVHPIWENNRPVPPNVVYLGGLPLKPDRELPMDLKSFLDSSQNGVIYISFGTNVDPSLIPAEKIQIFLRVFSKLPYDVLWKWDRDEMAGKPDNVRIQKWFPQSDLLKHPKVKLFITQGGLQSTDEAIIGGVPLIGIPMLADQWFNTDHYIKQNIGKQIELEDLREDNLMEAITNIIEDLNYRKNVEKLRSIMYNQPNTALERAIFWTEHVLQHGGGSHLRAEGANLSYRDYYELDLVALILVAVALATAVTILLLLKCFKIMSIRKKLKEN